MPRNAVITTAIVVALTVLLNYLMPEKALIYLIAITTSSIIVTWSTILVTHLNFRKKVNPASIKYKLPLFPYANLITIGLLAAVVVTMLFMDDMKMAVYLMPVWISLVTICYIIYLYITNQIGRAHQ